MLPVNQLTIARMILEAASRVNVKKQTRTLEIKLDNQLRRLFSKHSIRFLRGLARFQSEFSESLVDKLDSLFDSTSSASDMAKAIQTNVEISVTNGAQNLLEQLGDLDFDYIFNLKNPRAVEFIKNYGVNAVSGIDDESKRQLQLIVLQAVDHGWSYGKLSIEIRKRFTDWSTKRARLIAVTEIGNAYQHGNLIVGKDLVAAGLKMEKSWLTRKDEKVDPHCKANETDGWIDVNATFSSGHERPLDHPRCRCVLLMRRKVEK